MTRYLLDMTGFERKVADAYQRGFERNEIIAKLGDNAAPIFDKLDKEFKGGSIPIYKPRVNNDPAYLAWKGDI